MKELMRAIEQSDGSVNILCNGELYARITLDAPKEYVFISHFDLTTGEVVSQNRFYFETMQRAVDWAVTVTID